MSMSGSSPAGPWATTITGKSTSSWSMIWKKLVKASTLRCGSMHRTTLHLTKDQEGTRSGFQSSTVKRVPFFVPAADNTKLITNSNMKPYRESIYHNGGRSLHHYLLAYKLDFSLY